MEEIGKLGRDVFICDGNQKPMGTGVLFVQEYFEYAFIFTAAHLFWDKSDCSRNFIVLNIYSPFLRKVQIDVGRNNNLGQIGNVECNILQLGEGETLQDDGDSVVLLHSGYDPNDEYSSYDFAVIRLNKEEWMNEVKSLLFPNEFKEGISLIGYGYPQGGNVEQRQKKRDFFSGRMSFKCCSDQYDEKRREIKVTHCYKTQEDIKLHGYSGTGIFDEEGRFYGVVSRIWGADDAPGACVISGWLGFFDILQAFGQEVQNLDTPAENEIFIELDVRGHWLLDTQNERNGGLMDDRMVINLASLLFGMTDTYVVVLASTWKKGIASAIGRMIDEFVAQNGQNRENLPFPKWKESSILTDTVGYGEGLVLDIAASRPDLLVRVREILQRYEKKNISLIINVWSDKPEEALSAVASIYNRPELQSKGDYISLIDYSAKLKNTGMWTEELADTCMEQTGGMAQDRDRNTELWWSMISQTAKSESAQKDIEGYRIAKASKEAVQRWLCAQSEETVERLLENDALYGLLDQDEVDNLAIHLWKAVEEHPERVALRKFWGEIKNNCSQRILWLIDMLEGQRDIRDVIGLLRPEDIQIWSDFVTKDDFKRNIEKLKAHDFYWIVIMRGLSGYEYVMQERVFYGSDRFMSRLLNRCPKPDSDGIIEAQASYIRGFVRPDRNR